MPAPDPDAPPAAQHPLASGACPEHARLVRGAGRYVSDVHLPGALVVTFVRAPVATARVRCCDVSAARCAEGVVAVFTGSDVAAIGRLPVNPVLPRVDEVAYPVLAGDEVTAVGQPLAAIVAVSAQAGADAADLVALDFDEFPGGGPTLDGQVSGQWRQGDPDAGFAAAAHVVEATIQHPRLVPASLETRSIAVRVDGADDALEIWLSSQTPHRARTHLAAMLGVDAARLRVIAPDVGGAFGMKASLYPEEVLVVFAALTLRRSVRWQATRGEDFLAATHGRGALAQGRLAVAADGRFLGLQARIRCPLGNWLPNSAAVPAWNAGRILPGPYRCAAVDVHTQAVQTATAPVGIYRGAGRPEAAALMECLVEKAARVTGLDPLEIRRRNAIAPEQMPWSGPCGTTIDSGDYPATLAQLARVADYDALRARIAARRAQGECVGLGIALYVEPCGQGWESARVTVHPDGRIVAAGGGSAQGQSRVRVLAGIVADVFGVAAESVSVLLGDTASCPAGIGAVASRSTPIGASAMLQAARAAHEQWQQARAGGQMPTEPVVAEVVYETRGEAWGNGAYLAVVRIDTDTGAVRCEDLYVVDDVGRVLDKALVRDQILGGIAQGIGEALLENIVYDEHGQLLTGSLMDYALPRADDMPRVHLGELTTATPSPCNELGAKGVGEAGTIGVPAAVFNAVHDALGDRVNDDLPMPFTAERIWQVLQSTPPKRTSR